MLTDRLTVKRLELQLPLMERLLDVDQRVRNLMRERGLRAPTRLLGPGMAVQLLEHALLEDDDDLRNLWAQLLVNAADAASGVELRSSFISVLADLSAFDVRNLAALAAVWGDGSANLWTFMLPEKVIPARPDSQPQEQRDEVALSVSNLARTGCVTPCPGLDGYVLVSTIRMTPFGLALVKACSRS